MGVFPAVHAFTDSAGADCMHRLYPAKIRSTESYLESHSLL